MSEITWIFKVGVMQMIIPVLQLPRAKQKLYLFPPLCFQCVWNLTSITDFMNDWNITVKKTRPLKARLPEGGQTKALFNPSRLWQQAPGPVKPLGTQQSTPQNTAMALRKFEHMKLCVKYRGPGVFIFSTSRRLFSKECSQTEYTVARSRTTHLKITALTRRRLTAHIRSKNVTDQKRFYCTEHVRRECTGIFGGHHRQTERKLLCSLVSGESQVHIPQQ